MKSQLVAFAIGFLLICSDSHPAAAQLLDQKSLHAFLAAARGRKRTTTFSADTPAICAFWEGKGLGTGDTIGVIWIAEDIGGTNPKDTPIRRADYRIFKQEQVGEFSLSRPSGKTWPIGKYRVELYINGGIADTVKFTITQGVTIETH